MGDVLLLLYYYTLAKKFLNYQRLLSRLKHCRIFRDCFDSFYDMNTKISNYDINLYNNNLRKKQRIKTFGIWKNIIVVIYSI
jgi:hypothetical protein